jgi:membrane-bound lytic murein transglycosylase MltF
MDPYDPTSKKHAAVHFVDNLKRRKQAIITWKTEKNIKDEKEQVEVDLLIQSMHDGVGGGGVNTPIEKEELARLEKGGEPC